MILNHAKDIRFGEKMVLRVIWNNRIVWERDTVPFMPILTGVTGYFVAEKGFTPEIWENQSSGADMVFERIIGAQAITHTGDSIRIPAGAYGTFLPETDAFPENFTIYSIAKTEAVSSSAGQYIWSNYYNKSGTEGGIELSPGWNSGKNLAFRSIANQDLITEHSALEYHICAVSVTGSVGRAFVDGELIGTLQVSPAVVNALYLGRRAQSYDTATTYSQFASEYKFFAFAETAHTDAEVLRNMGWLLGDQASTIRTWDDLTAYSWRDAGAFTWDELNK